MEAFGDILNLNLNGPCSESIDCGESKNNLSLNGRTSRSSELSENGLLGFPNEKINSVPYPRCEAEFSPKSSSTQLSGSFLALEYSTVVCTSSSNYGTVVSTNSSNLGPVGNSPKLGPVGSSSKLGSLGNSSKLGPVGGPSNTVIAGKKSPPNSGAAGYRSPPNSRAGGYRSPPNSGAARYASPPNSGAARYASSPNSGAAGYTSPPNSGGARYASPPISGAAGYISPPNSGGARYSSPPISGAAGYTSTSKSGAAGCTSPNTNHGASRSISNYEQTREGPYGRGLPNIGGISSDTIFINTSSYCSTEAQSNFRSNCSTIGVNHDRSPNGSNGNRNVTVYPNFERNDCINRPVPLASQGIQNYALAPNTNVRQFPINAYALCSLCNNNGMVVQYRCCQCSIAMCYFCGEMHKSNIATHNHELLTINSVINGHNTPMCMDHPEIKAEAYCCHCRIQLCEDCTNFGHRKHEVITLKEHIQNERKKLEEMEVDVGKGMRSLTQQKLKAEENIKALADAKVAADNKIEETIQVIFRALLNRETELKQRVQRIHDQKFEELNRQRQQFARLHTELSNISAKIQDVQSEDSALLNIARPISSEIEEIRSKCLPLKPCEDAIIEFNFVEFEIFKAIQALGSVHSTASVAHTVLAGKNLHFANKNKENNIIVHVKDYLGQTLIPNLERDGILEVILHNGNTPLTNTRVHLERGRSYFEVTFTPRTSELLRMRLLLRGIDVPGSPICISVIGARDYTPKKFPFIFGCEGGGDGQFCRPWGICSDGEGNIIVGDRSNNRVQVFSRNGDFKFKFGCFGTEPGQFNRTAGVAWDSCYNRILVVDKDNHRVQIFDMRGKLIMIIGGGGTSGVDGFFFYPWDVTVNKRGEFLVSDARNHRLQLFDHQGNFLRKYKSAEKNGWRELDIPRGVCFFDDERVVITDFNNQKLGIIDKEFEKAVWLDKFVDKTKPDKREMRLIRPQSVAVDTQGNILVTDSRRHRLFVINVDKKGAYCINHIFGENTHNFVLNAPAQVSVSPEGNVLLCDFQNHRMVVF